MTNAKEHHRYRRQQLKGTRFFDSITPHLTLSGFAYSSSIAGGGVSGRESLWPAIGSSTEYNLSLACKRCCFSSVSLEYSVIVCR